MRIALIREGVVENVIEAGDGFTPGEGLVAVSTETAGPGWRYDGEAFFPPDPALEPVPQEIEMWRARAALAQINLLSIADEKAAQSGAVIAEFWKGATAIRRDSPTLVAFAESIGIKSAELDELFRIAARLTV